VTAASTVPAAASPGPVKRWVLGARPRTLPAALVPVLVGTAAVHPHFHLSSPSSLAGGVWWRALGALVVALSIQIGTNYANDYSDGIRGTDDVRVGPVRLVATGLASPAAVKRGALIAFGVAGVIGLWLASATSWWVLAVGAACLAAGWFYTGGPRPYGYAGFGELFVFVFFGLVATVGTYYVQTLRLGHLTVWLAAMAVGLLSTALLLANNLRDIETDVESGKLTLAVRVGRRRAAQLYIACLTLPFLGSLAWGVGTVIWVVVGHPAVSDWMVVGPFLPLLALPLAVAPIRTVLSDASGRALLPVLAATGKLQLALGVLLSAALVWWVG
jgi:1,4-dihydroxy-2-naphthoate octaprenyltransferase